jgi:hypothetical protein
MQELHKQLAKLDMDILNPILNGETRWNSNEAMLVRTDVLFPAIRAMEAAVMFPTKPHDRTDWTNLVQQVAQGLPIIMQIRPLLTKVAEWVQVLSAQLAAM